jgi:response regulator receiver domain-containing protein
VNASVDNIVKPLCVLVIEDEWLVRQIIAEHLRQAGCTVVEATTGEEALAFLNGVQPPIDILFTDIQLGGGLSGWEPCFSTNPICPTIYSTLAKPFRPGPRASILTRRIEVVERFKPALVTARRFGVPGQASMREPSR